MRLNLPAIQAVNFLIYPPRLILFLPFLQAGSWITGVAPVTLSMKEVFGMIKSDPWSLIKMLWTASLGATAIWMVMSRSSLRLSTSRLLRCCAAYIGVSRSHEPVKVRLSALSNTVPGVTNISNFPTSLA